MPPTFWIEGKTLSWEQIRHQEFAPEHFSAYSLSVLQFAYQWLNHTPFFEINTSGSTGLPKMIRISRKQMQYSALQTQKALGLQKHDKSLVCLNVQYIAGMMMLVRGFEIGMEMWVVSPQRNPMLELFLEFENPPQIFDFVAAVPLQALEIVQYHQLQHIKTLLLGGASVNFYLQNALKETADKSQVFLSYGMTETVSHIALRNLKNEEPFFTPLDEVELKIDKRSCLEIKSPVTNNQWITTNDIVELFEDKRFLLKGRIDNVINSGGVKINLDALENDFGQILYHMATSSRFFLAAIPDKHLGEKLVLVLEYLPADKESFTAEILRIARQILHPYQIPKEIFFLEKFEETPTTKINRKETLKKIQ